MQLPQEKINEFNSIMLKADWHYQYANGKAYSDGERSVFHARQFYRKLILDYPDCRKEIDELWSKRGNE